MKQGINDFNESCFFLRFSEEILLALTHFNFANEKVGKEWLIFVPSFKSREIIAKQLQGAIRAS